jgi:ribosome biogenesis GTPase / thiamine phosphate phosphatase
MNGAHTAHAEALRALGWDERLATLLESEASGLAPGRVIAEERGQYLVASALGDGPATASGRLRHETEVDPTVVWPAVGDWVAMEPSSDGEHRIQRVLTRRSAVVRGAPGDRRLNTQVLAANVDVVFVVTSVNAEFNIRRLERYLSVAWESGAVPVVLLSKSDLADDLESFRLQAEAAAPAVEIIAVSSVTGEGIEDVRRHLGPGRTVVFTGSSGVGKSSIGNALAGEPLLDTGGIRLDDARGRHTTTRRQLVRLADGLLIDTPGLRELGVLDAEGVATAFEDIEGMAAACRFGDCQHRSEPGCAVRAALQDGTLEAGRLEAYEKLQREARRAALATDAIARRAERKKWTAIHRSVGEHMKTKYGAER